MIQQLFERLRADRSGAYQERHEPFAESALSASLPPQYRLFLSQVGAGDFLFGRLLPADAARRLAVPGLYEFCRRGAWTYLFDLQGDTDPDIVWQYDPQTRGDVPGPIDKSFLAWVEEEYNWPWSGANLSCQLLLASDSAPPAPGPGLDLVPAPALDEFKLRTAKKGLHWVNGYLPPNVAGGDADWHAQRRGECDLRRAGMHSADAVVRESYRSLSALLEGMPGSELHALWSGEESLLPEYQLTLGCLEVGGQERELLVGHPHRILL